jgi:hypothetical protein
MGMLPIILFTLILILIFDHLYAGCSTWFYQKITLSRLHLAPKCYRLSLPRNVPAVVHRTAHSIEFKCRVLDELIKYEREQIAFPQTMVSLSHQEFRKEYFRLESEQS